MPDILFVEDEVIIALWGQMCLEDDGYIVEVAYDGEDALLKFRAEQPRLIITDIVMPQMDGLAMLAVLANEGFTD